MSSFFRFISILLFSFILLFESNAYMSKEDVFKELDSFSSKSSFVEPKLDEEGRIRESMLIPDREFLEGIPEAEKSLVEEDPSRFPDIADLRHRDGKIRRQDNGKCSAYASVAAIESLLNKQGKIDLDIDLSEWHAWSFYRTYSSAASIKALTQKSNRIGDEKDFPQYGTPQPSLSPYVFISKQKFLGDNFTAMMGALSRGNPVVLAMKTPRSMLNCDRVINPFTSAANGGHAILLVGYYKNDKGQPVGIIRNSWGSGCGDKGYQYLPMSVCHNSGFYCNMWEIEEVDSLKKSAGEPGSGQPAPAPEAPKFKEVCKRDWKSFWMKKKCEFVPVK